MTDPAAGVREEETNGDKLEGSSDLFFKSEFAPRVSLTCSYLVLVFMNEQGRIYYIDLVGYSLRRQIFDGRRSFPASMSAK